MTSYMHIFKLSGLNKLRVILHYNGHCGELLISPNSFFLKIKLEYCSSKIKLNEWYIYFHWYAEASNCAQKNLKLPLCKIPFLRWLEQLKS